MRKNFDGLSGIVRQQMGLDVVYGAVFIFLNRRRNQVKLNFLKDPVSKPRKSHHYFC